MSGASRSSLASSKLSLRTLLTYSGANRINGQYIRGEGAEGGRGVADGRCEGTCHERRAVSRKSGARHGARRDGGAAGGHHDAASAGAWRSRSRSSATAGASTTSTRRTRPTCSSRRATRPRRIGCSSSRCGGGRRPARWPRSSGRASSNRDIGARLHMFRGDLDAELNHYHPRGKAIVEAFVRGVNAYIAETERDAGAAADRVHACSASSRAAGRRPSSISRHQALAANLTDEVRYLRAIEASAPPRSCASCCISRAASRSSRPIRRSI